MSFDLKKLGLEFFYPHFFHRLLITTNCYYFLSRLVTDRETGKPKGYGFCEYKDEETALSARRNLQGYEINGRQLRVDFAENDKGADRNREQVKLYILAVKSFIFLFILLSFMIKVHSCLSFEESSFFLHGYIYFLKFIFFYLGFYLSSLEGYVVIFLCNLVAL